MDGLAHAFVTGQAEPAAVESFVAQLVERGSFVIATPALCEVLAGDPAAIELGMDPRVGPLLSLGVRAATGRPLPGFPPLAGMYRDALATVALSHRSGVPVRAGTDVNEGPHGPFAAAAGVPAGRFGPTGAGSPPGLRADLVLAAGDPTTDLTATRSIAGVWRGGVQADFRKGRLP